MKSLEITSWNYNGIGPHEVPYYLSFVTNGHGLLATASAEQTHATLNIDDVMQEQHTLAIQWANVFFTTKKQGVYIQVGRLVSVR